MALARLSEINVSTEGVMGAKDFFEAKVSVYLRDSYRLVFSCVHQKHAGLNDVIHG